MPEYITAVAVVFAVIYAARALRIYRRARDPRVVRCPATRKGATIELGAVRAALLLAPPAEHTVRRCSLWPGRRDCAQSCCDDLESSPKACSLQEVLARWYAGRACALCDRAIPSFEPGGFSPGLLSPAGRLVEWPDVEVVSVFDILETHDPVCASCDVSEWFRRRRPHLVAARAEPSDSSTDRPFPPAA